MTEQEKREKVIKGLDCCVNDLGECEVCPYDEGMGKPACGENLCSDAFALLIAHEPVKPVQEKRRGGYFRCGNCNARVSKVFGDKYCSQCGRAVKWE